MLQILCLLYSPNHDWKGYIGAIILLVCVLHSSFGTNYAHNFRWFAVKQLASDRKCKYVVQFLLIIIKFINAYKLTLSAPLFICLANSANMKAYANYNVVVVVWVIFSETFNFA